jgi:DNA-directed RNA polymerase specialized sigma24 family protein
VAGSGTRSTSWRREFTSRSMGSRFARSGIPKTARHTTQEILVRMVTHLGSFRAERRFMTWAYRVVANYLRTCRRSRVEEQRYTFERFGEGVAMPIAPMQVWREQSVNNLHPNTR